MANSKAPDQTAPLEAVWPGSALFAQTYLSRDVRKTDFGICENKDADQLREPQSWSAPLFSLLG